MLPLGYTAITAVAAGRALSAAALLTYLNGRAASQNDAHRANELIERYNQLSLIPDVTAATTGAICAWLQFGSQGSSSVSVGPFTSLGHGEAFLGLDGRF